MDNPIHTETVDLSSRGIVLPADRVGMVMAQPYLSLTEAEPYRCAEESKQQQLAVLTDTLAVARAAHHGVSKTHFTVFPEYCIPGPAGIALVDTAIRTPDWPNGTIVIAGTDALSKSDFEVLATTPDTHLDSSHNALARIGQNEWINCGVIWVKAADGTVERWLQPKLAPAWPEQRVLYQNMFHGKSVFGFKGMLENGTQYRFSSLVCFDWVATVNNIKAWRWVLDDLHRQADAAQAELSLTWFFVIQCNRKPSDDSFLNEVAAFFDQTTLPNVRRDRACLVFANSAGKRAPGRADLFGCTSLVFSPQTLFADHKYHPTFCNGGARFRSSTLLSAYRDVLFRERGACVHSFAQVNPNSLIAGSTGKTIALQNAFVFPLNGTTDPRAPAAMVPADVKWLNDELDELPCLAARYSNAALASQVDASHQQSVAALRAISPKAVTRTVKLAAEESEAAHADDWDNIEAEALEHVVHTLDIIGIGCPAMTVEVDSAHAAFSINSKTVDVLAIRGASHERCIEHSICFSPHPQHQVLLVSRDRDNTPWLRRFGSILQPEIPRLGQERKITDPASGSLHLGYERLLDIFRNSTTAAAVKEAIYAELDA
jgi:hypothetical protein